MSRFQAHTVVLASSFVVVLSESTSFQCCRDLSLDQVFFIGSHDKLICELSPFSLAFSISRTATIWKRHDASTSGVVIGTTPASDFRGILLTPAVARVGDSVLSECMDLAGLWSSRFALSCPEDVWRVNQWHSSDFGRFPSLRVDQIPILAS